MAKRPDLIEKQKASCKRKKKYKTDKIAMDSAKRMQKISPFTPATYRCMICGAIHLTSVKVSKQKYMVPYYYGA